MNELHAFDDACPQGMAISEWRARLELAACYRLFDHLGWTEMIFNHITLRVDGPADQAPQYLINPYGLHYCEVTARNLVKTDTAGNVIGDSSWPINPAGAVIHSAVHAARHDARCVMHTHTTAGMAVACKQEGLRHDNFYSAMLYGALAYHDFEGVTTNPDECERLVASLGDRPLLILRNHGLLAAGPNVAHTLATLWVAQRACEVQLAADGVGGENWPVSEAILKSIPAQREPMNAGGDQHQMMFDAMLRRAGIQYASLI